ASRGAPIPDLDAIDLAPERAALGRRDARPRLLALRGERDPGQAVASVLTRVAARDPERVPAARVVAVGVAVVVVAPRARRHDEADPAVAEAGLQLVADGRGEHVAGHVARPIYNDTCLVLAGRRAR